jgi:hypothetical protein
MNETASSYDLQVRRLDAGRFVSPATIGEGIV